MKFGREKEWGMGDSKTLACNATEWRHAGMVSESL
jgi:hypothetical protein